MMLSPVEGPARHGRWLRACAAAVAAALAAGPASAQVQAAGRWSLRVESGVPVPLRGELRLAQEGDRLSGLLLLESQDARPVPIGEGRIAREGWIEFAAEIGRPARFTGRIVGDRIAGQLEAGGEPGRWSAERLAAGVEHYAALPRFTLRQIETGGDSTISIPGRWARAAAAPSAAELDARYRELATAAGLVPLTGDTLIANGQLQSLGLFRRGEMRAALERTLAAVRAALPIRGVRARFDGIFRPRGEWIVDLHDAALARARFRDRALEWEAARPALAGVGWIDSARSGDAVPLGLYRLLLFATSDSAGFARLTAQMRAADSASADAVAALLDGYRQSADWYLVALRWLVAERWIPGAGGSRTLADLAMEGVPADAGYRAPALALRLFGSPQAVPRYGVPPELFARLIRAENLAAREWLDRHGQRALLAALRKLPPGDSMAALLTSAGRTYRLSSVPRQARVELNGFLEPDDQIVIDPGYPPLLALGTVVHEWQHLALERARQIRGAADSPDGTGPLRLVPADPYLAEGFAEWRTDQVLAPLIARWPLLGVPEAGKRARLAATAPEGSHVLGYRLVLALAAAVRDPARTTQLLVRHGDSPGALAADPALRGAWRGRPAPARGLSGPGVRLLLPEVTFTLEDNYPDVVSTRILAPAR